MKIRSGITLVEVLVAIFIMGVGLLAILVLFPIGALNMARAIRDDRAAHCGAQAEAIANMWDLRHDPAVTAMLDSPPGMAPIPRGDTPSYPVLIDPFGAPFLGSPLGDLGGSPGLRRVSPNGIPTPPNGALIGDRWFTFLDDINFTPDGRPEGMPVSVQRYGSYTWTYIARRPQFGNKSLVDLTVLVYKGRPTLTPGDEPTFNTSGNAGDSTLTLAITPGSEPDFRTGGYLLDTSLVPTASGSTVAAQAYQVTDIVKDSGSWTLRVEPPLRNNVNTVALLESVIAVFEKGTGWQP